MSKDNLKSFINKVGTFRQKDPNKKNNQRPSVSDLKYGDPNDEHNLRHNSNIDEHFSATMGESDLDTTVKSFTGSNNSFRSSVQTLNFNTANNNTSNIYDRMTDEQIIEEFEKSILAVNSLNLKNDDALNKMRILTIDQKRDLLKNMLKMDAGMDDKASHLANALRDAVRSSKNLKDNLKQLYKIIKRISVCIASKPVSWLEEFNQASGFQALQEIITDYKTKYSLLYNNNSGIQYYNSNQNQNMTTQQATTYNNNEFKDKDSQLGKEIRFECMKTLKSFVNTKYGIKVVLESKSTLMAIATAIDCNDPQTMNVACLLLAVLAVLDQEKVLAAIGESAKFTGNHRFYSIVKGLTINEDKELKISSMLLINALICNADSLDFKIHLRSDFNRCGLIQAIENVKNKYGYLEDKTEFESDKLFKQIYIFENHAHDNFEEMDSYVENIMGFWDDPKLCFEYIYNSIKDTPSEYSFLSILQHLILVRDDFQTRYSYFRLIEECVVRIALHKDGRDPDFEYTSKFDFDIESLLKALKEAVSDEMAKNGGTGKLTPADSKKLEQAISEKQELEARVQTLGTKLKCTEEALGELKAKVPNEIANEIEAMLQKRLTSELAVSKQSSVPPPAPPPPPPGMGFPPPPPPPPPPPMFGGGPPPPPPPPPPFGMLPPPPPPPMGGGGGPPAPPMLFGPSPPPALPHGMKEKKKYKVEQPLKKISWNKIQTQSLKENSFWVKANEEKFASDDVFKILMDNFSTKQTKPISDSKNNSDETMVKKKGQVKELRHLDDKQAQNLSILLKSLKAEPNEISKWLIECNMDKLTVNSLEQMEKFLPEDTTLGKFQELKENIDELDNSEKFLTIISQIKGLRKRIRSLIFKAKFHELEKEIISDLVAGTEACTDLKKSEKFQKLLEVLLLVGNFMNSGSNLEGTFGFEMKYLPKFYTTKANDNKRTLLHLVAQIINDKYPLIANFYEDFQTFMDQACKIDSSILQKSLNDIKININHLDNELRASGSKRNANDRYVEIMESFLSDTKTKYENFECRFNKMNELYKDLADFYAFDVVKYPLGELFTDLKTFTAQFQQCMEENKKLKETEEKIKRAEEDKQQREKEKQVRKTQKEKIMQSTKNGGDMGDTGVMDNLLEALQSGKLFEAGGGGPGGNMGMGRGRRPMRRDNNLMADFRRTMHKQPPRVVLQPVQ